MVLGWRRAFCSSVPWPRRDGGDSKGKQEENSNISSTYPKPNPSTKFSFFSNPSTPRFQTHQLIVNTANKLNCGTTTTTTTTNISTPPAPLPAAASVPHTPNLKCKTKIKSPTLFHPSSPRSPFSLIKSSLRLRLPKSKSSSSSSSSRCGICLQRLVKAGQGTSVFTAAECSHSFHFQCIAAQQCPICNLTCKQMPIQSIQTKTNTRYLAVNHINTGFESIINKQQEQHTIPRQRPVLKIYNDDEPLASPTSAGFGFVPIPESDENEEDAFGEGFFVNPNAYANAFRRPSIEVNLLPEVAVVASVGRSHLTYAVVMRIRAPTKTAAINRAPIDLVAVLDVGMTPKKLQMMKQFMRFLVSSLSSADRLSIIAFSAASKRLLPLYRMSSHGRRSARRIVDMITILDGTASVSANDAIKKAFKVLDDRREKNPVAGIILLSDNNDDSTAAVTSTRHDIAVHRFGLGGGENSGTPPEDPFARLVEGLLNVVVQDLRLQLEFASGSDPAEITAIYSTTRTGGRSFSRPDSVWIGDLWAEEERKLFVELKVPPSSERHLLSVRCSYKDPSTRELVSCTEQPLVVPHPHAVRSSSTNIQRLRSLFISTRAIVESRRLIECNNLNGAHRMLSSARALLLQTGSGRAEADEFVNCLDLELSKLQRMRLTRPNAIIDRERTTCVDEKGEALTPTSAWRAAERLAKLAIMRKSLNRVGDLHGLEDARF